MHTSDLRVLIGSWGEAQLRHNWGGENANEVHFLGEITHRTFAKVIMRDRIPSSYSSTTSVSGETLSNADPQSTMGSNASTGLGGEVTHGVWDIRPMETDGNESSTEVTEETNRKSQFPISKNPRNTNAESTLIMSAGAWYLVQTKTNKKRVLWQRNRTMPRHVKQNLPISKANSECGHIHFCSTSFFVNREFAISNVNVLVPFFCSVNVSDWERKFVDFFAPGSKSSSTFAPRSESSWERKFRNS